MRAWLDIGFGLFRASVEPRSDPVFVRDIREIVNVGEEQIDAASDASNDVGTSMLPVMARAVEWTGSSWAPVTDPPD